MISNRRAQEYTSTVHSIIQMVLGFLLSSFLGLNYESIYDWKQKANMSILGIVLIQLLVNHQCCYPML